MENGVACAAGAVRAKIFLKAADPHPLRHPEAAFIF
jgi:hypothetical protein